MNDFTDDKSLRSGWTTTLGDLHPDQVDMRTVVIVGSSKTRAFPRAQGGSWVYTPRWYPA